MSHIHNMSRLVYALANPRKSYHLLQSASEVAGASELELHSTETFTEHLKYKYLQSIFL